jgi:hypothetical protein
LDVSLTMVPLKYGNLTTVTRNAISNKQEM